jgi:hypothetical protein
MSIWLEDVIEQICIARILRDSKTTSGRRLSMILVDNAIEFVIKVHGENIIPPKVLTRKEWDEKKRHFEELVNLVIPRTKASSYQQEILDFHRVRNDLYHGTTPLSVEPDKINRYIEITCGVLESVCRFSMTEEEWKERTEGIQAILRPQVEKKGLVSFYNTDDGLAKFQTGLELKDTDAILLMIYGFTLKTGKPPESAEQLGKCLNYSGHQIRMERLRVNIAHLRSANKINKKELTLTTQARNYIKAKYIGTI